MNLAEFKEMVNSRLTAVVGVGVSNLPLVKMLIENGAKVAAYDKKSKEEFGTLYDELKKLGVEFHLGENYLSEISEDTEILFKTPGIRYDKPELLKAKERGTVITSEMEMFFKLCPAPIIAVTGSDGKTTTTTLITEILKQDGYNCYVGGNIGKPLLNEAYKMNSEDRVVLELSSFQLHTMEVSPSVAVVTNVTPNHLDWHTDFEEYKNSKKNIFKFMNDDGRVVLNFDNDNTRDFAIDAKNVMFFSRQSDLENGVCLNGDNIVIKKDGNITEEILNINEIAIPGLHNVENYMAAIAATYGMVSIDSVREVARNFGGVEHRIELVRTLDGVKYYNDSIASSPARTTAGLLSFKDKVILIAGGYDKKIPFDDFGAVVNDHVKKLILVGKTSDKIESAVKNAENYSGLEILKFSDFKEAVEGARKEAESGDTVILSPACASFDLFKNFEERGNMFKEIVNNFTPSAH